MKDQRGNRRTDHHFRTFERVDHLPERAGLAAEEQRERRYREPHLSRSKGARRIHQVDHRFQRIAEIGLEHRSVHPACVHVLLVTPDRDQRPLLRVLENIRPHIRRGKDVLLVFHLVEQTAHGVRDQLRRIRSQHHVHVAVIVGLSGSRAEQTVGILEGDQPRTGIPCGGLSLGPAEVVRPRAVPGYRVPVPGRRLGAPLPDVERAPVHPFRPEDRRLAIAVFFQDLE